MPQSPNHPAYWHAHPRRHGDMVRADGGSAANDMIIDGHPRRHPHRRALARLPGRPAARRPDADEAAGGGRYVELGVHTIEPMVRRGVLLDVPRRSASSGSTPARRSPSPTSRRPSSGRAPPIGAGDVVLVRSGWGQHFDTGDGDTFRGLSTGVPGVGEAGATWLRRPRRARGRRRHHRVRAARARRRPRPAARRTGCCSSSTASTSSRRWRSRSWPRDGVHEFLFVLSPLPFFGATGSPVRPLAVVGA